MRFTIITPTVQRQSLLKACASVDSQVGVEWEHVVMVDSAEFNADMMLSLAHPRRTILHCDRPHRNGGNTCRHNAWALATGDYFFYLDDDNYLADEKILEDLSIALEQAGNPQWGIFPILRHGQRFYFNPPQPCYVDTGNVVVRREVGRWPDIPDYCSDAVWVEGLKQYPFAAFPDSRPIMVMPDSSFGAGGGINGQ